MRLNELEKWGIPPRVIEKWRVRQGEVLLPVQKRAVHKGLLGQAGYKADNSSVRMIISAPTSSGKSFCAEMAAMRALTARHKTVMLFPLKSLAEQKYEVFKRTYGELGVKCLIVTGDHPENDRQFLDGDYQIAVVIYEKFDLLLTSSLDILRNIGLVVVDEIQTITEPGRGAVLERLLTKISASGYSLSLLGLSAVIGDNGEAAGQLAAWLKATLVEASVRPVELVRGIAAEGLLRWRSFNNGLDGSEPFPTAETGEEPFVAFVKRLKTDSGSTLIFLKSRMETVEYAFRLAASVNWPDARQALEKLDGEEPSFLIRSLRQALSRGVAFHNSDLSSYQRSVVEQAFIDKEVRALFSTTTLAMGVNLPADTVYLETVKYTSGKYNSRPSLVPVTKAEFDNMTGRAGRLKSTQNVEQPGRAIVLAESEFDREVLWENYIACDRSETIRSAFETMPLEDWLFNLIACGLVSDRDRENLTGIFKHTLFAALNGDEVLPEFSPVLDELVAKGLVIDESDHSRIAVTGLGQAAARTGLSVEEIAYYQRYLEAGYPQTSFGWLALALSGPGWHLPPAVLSRSEQAQNLPLKMLYQQYDHLVPETSCLLGRDYRREPLTYRRAASLKVLLLLELWRQLVAVERLEERFQMHLGQIMAVGETAGHLLASLAELVGAIDREAPIVRQLRDDAFSVRHGMPVSLKPMHDHLGKILHRGDFAALHKAGIETLGQLCETSQPTLSAIIVGKRKLLTLNEKIDKLKEEVQVEANVLNVVTRPASLAVQIFGEPERVEIDGAFEGERYLVRINGFPVRLTGKSFKYFTKLAWSRLKRESGWIYKEDIEIGFNQARYLYRMKGEIASGLNTNWPIIENNRLGYYRLNVDPSKIHINVDNLKNHPDYEVRSLVEGRSVEPVN